MSDLIEILDIYSEAAQCEDCFESGELSRGSDAIIKHAQPRWIGPDYFTSDKRYCVVLINPGKVGQHTSNYVAKENEKKFQEVLVDLKDGRYRWHDLSILFCDSMPHWKGSVWKKGYTKKTKVNFAWWYFGELGIPIRNSAIVNILLCYTEPKPAKFKKKQKEYFFKNCYKRYTKNLLQQLNPTHLFLNKTFVSDLMFDQLKEDLPGVSEKNINVIYHYAHKLSSKEDAQLNAEQVRNKYGFNLKDDFDVADELREIKQELNR
tara:strand:+ start:397 stop:1185 length:789 start_codon:yes stop_codon:yes gene_type:complete